MSRLSRFTVSAACVAALLMSRAAAADDLLAKARQLYNDKQFDAAKFGPRERLEYVTGLGEALYFDGAFGAAADVFESVLRGPEPIQTDSRERVLDWWADALDRDARPRPDID